MLTIDNDTLVPLKYTTINHCFLLTIYCLLINTIYFSKYLINTDTGVPPNTTTIQLSSTVSINYLLFTFTICFYIYTINNETRIHPNPLKYNPFFKHHLQLFSHYLHTYLQNTTIHYLFTN